jgi:hypothetical protein
VWDNLRSLILSESKNEAQSSDKADIERRRREPTRKSV